ncbi:TPA: transposase [Legionella pneumophila]|nr:transposase [Legionella pneumophila]HAT2065480.1 hypothetical protein [Legionella pneumophila]HAT8591973.1 hypothetical protein [Legionella pneumophila]HAU1575711.1 hypothetical protein [Legionella pneumophila]HAU1679718.1 hypothetical protein [Legionella pneumophila]HAU3699397.1 hypothetical protein [Legionella pneumophila]
MLKKRQEVLNESPNNKVLALYAISLKYEVTSKHLSEMYGLEVSSPQINLIIDKLLPLSTEWLNRSLESVYPKVFLDAMHF